nr:RidA family protein [Anaerostipes hominis (ex Lee et al. 2021)]
MEVINVEYIFSENAPKAIGPYSQAVKVKDTLYLSGVMPINPETNSLVESDITTQANQVIKNIDAILKEAGMDANNVVKTTCFISDMEYFAAFNEVYAKYFISKPARSCVAVKSLPKNALIEIEVIAIQ